MGNPGETNQIIINARFVTQPITGVQRFAIEISRQLKRMMPEIKFVAPQNIIQRDIAEELQVESLGYFTSHVWEQMELPFYLKKKGNPLLVNLCNTAPLYYSNKVVCIHDLAFIINPDWFSKTFAGVYRFLIPRIAADARKVLTVSNFSKISIQSILKVPAEKIEVIYNAVSESFILNGNIIAGNKFGRYILAVSSIEPRKNLKNLIIGFKQAKLTGVKLVIVGAGSKVFNDPDLKELVQKTDNIIFTGYISDQELVGVYKNALMFIYPSLYEGFGIPPLEAMHCGCPSIVSDTSSLPEVCADASIYVNPLNTGEIAEAILKLYQNEAIRNKLINKGLSRVKYFDWEVSAKKLVGILNNLP